MPAALPHAPVPPPMSIRAILAAVVTLGTFPASAGPARLRRAATLMAGGGLLHAPVSVAAPAAR